MPSACRTPQTAGPDERVLLTPRLSIGSVSSLHPNLDRQLTLSRKPFWNAHPGILLSSVLEQLWSESGSYLYDVDPSDVTETITRRHRTVRIHRRRDRSSRTHLGIPGAPEPDPPSVERHRRTKHHITDRPFTSQWEGLQQPIDRTIGLENEVTELRRRASAAAGEVRRLQEEKKWAIAQGNKAREFQLTLYVVHLRLDVQLCRCLMMFRLAET